MLVLACGVSSTLRLKECHRAETVDEMLLGLGTKELVVEVDVRAANLGGEAAFLGVIPEKSALMFAFYNVDANTPQKVELRPTAADCRKLIRAARRGAFVVAFGRTVTTFGLTDVQAYGLEEALWECLLATQREG
jgi:hypothetical protein